MIDVPEVKQFIKKNLKATLGLKEISSEFNKHPADLDRAFRTSEGITIKKYIDRRLTAEVARLLQQNKLRGYEIGNHLGFWSDQSFYRWTKRVFGVTYASLHGRFGAANGRDSRPSPLDGELPLHRKSPPFENRRNYVSGSVRNESTHKYHLPR
ncbi:MAG: helix-turn-helix transcriptional regulator [Ignavibacteria bacterium]|nr:MAG: helix-turn-helix transcriptional regulator [Ignavibacteria bacterium]